MKKSCYTIIEMLTVIAVIAILAAIIIPTVSNARARGRLSACSSNQGQTMKIVLAAMADRNGYLHSGENIVTPHTDGTLSDKGSWITFLVEKNYVQSLDVVRCPGFNNYEKEPKVIDDDDALKEVYGMVVANSGKFDFRRTNSRTYTVSSSDRREIPANAMVLGGCTSKDKKPYAMLKGCDDSALDGDVVGKVAQVHRQNSNLFFLDGHSETVDARNYKENKYVPDPDGSSAQLFTADWEAVE